MEKIIWEGRHLMAPEGTRPKLGDAPLTFTVSRPRIPEWREDSWFCVDLRADQYSEVVFTASFNASSGQRLQVQFQLLPCVNVSFRVRLDELWNKRFFLPTFPGAYKGSVNGLPLNPADVDSVTIGIAPGVDFRRAVVTRVYLSDRQPASPVPEKPIIDEMGQLIGGEWPTKTHSYADMEKRLKAEYERAKVPVPPRPGCSAYGGYTAKRFEATGFFRTEHDGRRWWLVDPEGCAFFSHGVCYGTRMGEFGWYSGMEGFYQAAPSPDDPEYADAFTHPGLIAEYVKRHGVTERSNEWMFNPARYNMIRVFGKDSWWEAWRAIAGRRFRDWGINTTGVGIVNFIDERLEDFLRLTKIPYAVTLKRFPVTEHFIFRDFPDVFAPEYEANSATFAENELKPMAEDPYLLGYFMHNEPEWMFQEGVNIAYELLVKPEPLESRRHFAAWLQARYGDAARLSEAWSVDIDSFERLREPLPRGVTLSERGMADLREYEQILIDAFGQIPMAACRKAAPNHLNMGLRYSRVTERILTSCKAFDIFSFNCYRKRPEDVIALARKAGKPMLIGEWHFGAPDNGLFRTALVSAVSQEERGRAYRRYMERVASDPAMVGAHYFEYNNQTLMGRFDGEHMAHGLIDCTNLPYPAMAEAIKTTSGRLWDVLNGNVAPFDEEIRYLEPHW